jgi:hypothetical protein
LHFHIVEGSAPQRFGGPLPNVEFWVLEGSNESWHGLDGSRPDRCQRMLASITAMAPEAFARNFEADAPPQRYPDPDIVVIDKRFRPKLGNMPIQRLYTGTL